MAVRRSSSFPATAPCNGPTGLAIPFFEDGLLEACSDEDYDPALFHDPSEDFGGW